ncbi:MAG: Transcriptional regulator, TraR/DksA family [Candidatus Gottesmanbacteria bacterium GW2011_GWA2_44_17]|uniref:Transcriptional regulator, TraR/DksA family n=3 Tax=Candidatus Gottesmaniibacteriota TaxID=1752720 RepID=A0A0G1IHW5_9BACT|nr:MAG: Transcriptional regulator, TraR/DksA family [Microgenomates group bacterium GW2011_GWC1_43_11]KKT35725.1 MAG: Transcriptional regulator, TraR/DksA family [Candidatus Gottesmanbacteria bacterium GW2011_GWB1_44_11c]KKT45995.1 MAG: Transcriptional regulator, TraR/DksA family [Candidatus Gottesmanbacteria bacterium GW2011_GWA2_44_17]KKT58448.1 MAG: Transcriptional regulator, TraR/DksA family [Candidatus Gottesmanbacteria bacterium GW2011_GWA1_44_24b]HCM82349.1 RNA polymerase-binding protein
MQNFPNELLSEIRVQLEEEKKLLEARIDELVKQDPFSDPDRLTDNAASDRDADEESAHDRFTAIIEELRMKRKKIDDALLRVSTGDYGFCTKCGNMIDTDRLSILPTATLCKTCEEKKKRT